MKVETTLQVEGDIDGDEEFIDVVIEGNFESFTSHNRFESGMSLTGIEVVSPQGYKLTERQREIAEQKLYNSL